MKQRSMGPSKKEGVDVRKNLMNFANCDDNSQTTKKPKRKTKNENKFPINIFPQPIQDIILDAYRALNFPIDFLASGMLFASSAAIGNSHLIEIKEGYQQNAVIFLAIVGKPGTNKSHPLSFAIDPLAKEDSIQFKNFKAAKKAFDADNSEDSEKPFYKRSLISDTTIEAMQSVLVNNPRGLGLYMDELAAWVKNFERYSKGSAQESWLSIWSGKSITIDRKSQDPTLIESPFVSVCGTIQPSVIHEIAKNNRADNGFLDRMIFAYLPNLKKPNWSDSELNPNSKPNWKNIIDNLLNLSFEEGKPKIVRFSPEAKERYREYHIESTNEANNPLNEDIRGLYAKIEMYCIRFALILQLLHYASDSEPIDNISLKATEGAIKLANYFLENGKDIQTKIKEKDPKENLTSIKKSFYIALPHNFKTEDAIQIGVKHLISESGVKRMLRKKELFERLGHGAYFKLL